MPFMDRASFIALLAELGDESDEKALAAAREIDRRMTEAELDWEDLLVPEGGAQPADPDDEDDDDDDGDDDDRPEPTGDSAEDLKLIAKLLDDYELSDSTREELEDFRADVGHGEFTAMDRRYVQSLKARLDKSKKK